MKKYKAVFASTVVDSQGERYSKDDLESIVSGLPNLVHLGSDHDVGSLTQAVATNLRVEPHEKEPGEWVIAGEIDAPDDFEYAPRVGLSLSVVEPIEDTQDDPILAVYIPWPLYNKSGAFDALRATGIGLRLGKWKKKAADPTPIGIIITLATFVLRPAWDDFYHTRVGPAIKRVLAIGRDEHNGLKYDVVYVVKDSAGTSFQLRCNRQSEEFDLNSEIHINAIKDACGLADLAVKHRKSSVKVARAIYRAEFNTIDVVQLELEDGTVVSEEGLIDLLSRS